MKTNARALLTAICLLVATIICVATLLPIAGCGSKETAKGPSIVGEWNGASSDGRSMTFAFKKDMAVVWTITSSSGTTSLDAKYSIDYTTKPVSLEIRDFKQPEVKKYIFWGVLKFEDSKHFHLDGEQHVIGASASRPKKLTSNAILFSKVK